MSGFNPLKMSIEEQLDFLMEGSYFADEGKLTEGEEHSGGLRSQMRLELKQKLEKALAKGERLRIYIGADPTRPSLHIGHMVPVSKLARFQRLGHQVIFLIGDYTAMIGDPTGQSSERKQFSHTEVLELSKFYTSQCFRLLHEQDETKDYEGGSLLEPGVEIRYNGEWLSRLALPQLMEIAAQFPVAQLIAREDFRKRLESGSGLRGHELFYGYMQGYDAFALNCDVQIGGYDQHFNLLAGRILQEHYQKVFKDKAHPLFEAQPATGKWVKGPHAMLTFPLLMGTDGRKMSKSWGNTIDVLDSPEDMYGKVMRISDAMIEDYINIAVEAPREEKQEALALIATEPLAAKKWVAWRITEMYNGAEAADSAAEHFQRTVQDKRFEESDVIELTVPVEFRDGGETLVKLITALKLAGSNKEAQRLIEGGGVRLDGEAVSDRLAQYTHKGGAVLQLGKRRLFRLV